MTQRLRGQARKPWTPCSSWQRRRTGRPGDDDDCDDGADGDDDNEGGHWDKDGDDDAERNDDWAGDLVINLAMMIMVEEVSAQCISTMETFSSNPPLVTDY